jgi:APA family basic amino acid/polyamine antiporter
MVLAGPRVYFAMARDGMFVRAAGRVHPRFHTPAAALVAQSIWRACSGVGHAVAARELHGVCGRALLRDRRRRALRCCAAATPAPPLRRDRPLRVRSSAIGYPWAPALFVAASAVMLVNEVWRNPVPTVAGVALIVAGVPVYFMIRARR